MSSTFSIFGSFRKFSSLTVSRLILYWKDTGIPDWSGLEGTSKSPQSHPRDPIWNPIRSISSQVSLLPSWPISALQKPQEPWDTKATPS